MALPSGLANSSTQEIHDVQEEVASHILSFIKSMSLKCAIQLGIPDIIQKHGKPMSVSELASAIPINKAKSSDLNQLMRILTHSKLFDKVIAVSEDEEEAYYLTRASCLLLGDEPLTMVHLTLLALDPIMMDPGHHLSEWFQNEDSAPFVTKHGRTFWEYSGCDQRLNELFNKSMAARDAGLVTSILANKCRQVFEGLKTMVDVGGGIGDTAKGFSDVFPELKCTVLDLPQVVAGLQGSHNLTFIGGDMFQSIPHADALFFKNIFHDWDDENCVKILKRCREAIGNGGKVIIVDIVVGNKEEEHQKSTEIQLCSDMLMMILHRGKERSEKEWAKLFFDAGFSNYNIFPVLGRRSVIEVFP